MPTNITKTVYKVGDFLSWQRAKFLVLSPSFQRRSVWPAAAKSFFIDTIARGHPIPIVFLREQTNLDTLEPFREVVDGQQRLRTLLTYIEPESLRDYDAERDAFEVKKTHNSELAGKTFKHLPADIRRRILGYEFSVHVLPSDTDDREVLQIFARMNATGVKLNDQELRNARFYGEFKKTSYSLAYEQLLPGTAIKAIDTASNLIQNGQFDDELAKVLRGATSDTGSRQKRLDFMNQAMSSAQEYLESS
jgi:hypothetical protein